MKTESVSNCSENKRLITGVKKVERIQNTKSFDYYTKRGLTQERQGEKEKSITPQEAYEIGRMTSRKNIKSEKDKVREFKQKVNVKIGIEAYKKILEDAANMQEQKSQESKTKEQEK